MTPSGASGQCGSTASGGGPWGRAASRAGGAREQPGGVPVTAQGRGPAGQYDRIGSCAAAPDRGGSRSVLRCACEAWALRAAAHCGGVQVAAKWRHVLHGVWPVAVSCRELCGIRET